MWQIDPEFLSTLSEIHVRGSQREADNKILFIEIPRNSVEILSNTCLYNIRETFLIYWGYLLAVNLLIYLETWSLKRANNVLKLPGVDYVAKNWALAMMSKALLLVQFWSVLLLKEQMMTAVRKTLKTLVWSAQNQSISNEVFPENNHKICIFWPIDFWLSPKIPAKLVDFSANLPLKMPWNLTFFPQPVRSPA